MASISSACRRHNPTINERAAGHCNLGFDRADLRLPDDPLERFNDNTSLLSAVVHPGGGVALTSTEDAGDFDGAFTWYERANSKHRMQVAYDPVQTQVINERIRKVFDADLLAQKSGHGCPDPAPIFIVGLPRSGSTLIEQILASHSQVEGTSELPELGKLATSLNRQGGGLGRDR